MDANVLSLMVINANTCTTEMQVTSLFPRPSTPHTIWTGCSVEGLGTRLSSVAHLTMVHSCMLMQYKVSRKVSLVGSFYRSHSCRCSCAVYPNWRVIYALSDKLVFRAQFCKHKAIKIMLLEVRRLKHFPM